MKVLIQPRRPQAVRGWCQAFATIGYECITWEAGRPLFDVFDEEKPDIFVLTDDHADIPVVLEAYPDVMVVDRRGRKFVPAFDAITYKPGVSREDLACDITFFGEYAPHKAPLIDRYLMQICRDARYHVKVFGNGNYGLPQHLGYLPDSLLPDLVASARICLSVGRGRISERGYMIMGLGGYYVSNLSSPDVFGEIARVLFDLPDYVRQQSIDGLRHVIFAAQTYSHRVAYMLKELHLDDDAARVLDQIVYPETGLPPMGRGAA